MKYCQGDVISSDDAGTSEEDGPGGSSSDIWVPISNPGGPGGRGNSSNSKESFIFTSLTFLSLEIFINKITDLENYSTKKEVL